MSRLISDWSHARKEITGDRRDFKWGKHHLQSPWLEEDSEQMIFGLRPEREGGKHTEKGRDQGEHRRQRKWHMQRHSNVVFKEQKGSHCVQEQSLGCVF